MTDKFKNKYRIPPARLQNWNYGAMGSYFVTICTRNREHFFGKIVSVPTMTGEYENEMQLNDIGKKVEEEWLRTIKLRPDMNLELGNFVVMPNHFHGILIIGANEFNSDAQRMHVMHSTDAIMGRDAMHGVSTAAAAITNTKNQFGPQSKNLGSIIRGFKSAVTTYSKINDTIDFGWQPRFHDHIIRNSAEFDRIQNYITNNVANWDKDKFYK
jgi:putative transposase